MAQRDEPPICVRSQGAQRFEGLDVTPKQAPHSGLIAGSIQLMSCPEARLRGVTPGPGVRLQKFQFSQARSKKCIVEGYTVMTHAEPKAPHFGDAKTHRMTGRAGAVGGRR